MTLAVLLLGAVTAERLAELWLARRNTAALLAQGASEFAPGHYPAIVLLHALWIASLWLFGWTHPLSSIWLIIFLALQVLRVWILATLGRRWTTRIYRSSRRAACRRRPLSRPLASELSRRHWRDRNIAALLRLALAVSALLHRECRYSIRAHTRGECGVDRIGQCQQSIAPALSRSSRSR